MPELTDSTGYDWTEASGQLTLTRDTVAYLLKEWTESEAFEATSLTRDSDGVTTSATVVWPDGSAGTYALTTKNTTWLCADAYTVSHTDSGLTVTQAAVTRNSAGEVTTKPALTVA